MLPNRATPAVRVWSTSFIRRVIHPASGELPHPNRCGSRPSDAPPPTSAARLRVRTSRWHRRAPLPFLYPLIRGATDHLVEHVASAVPYMDRVETRNEAGLSDRDLVWSNASAYWWTVPSVRKIAGFGPAGQQTSGASATYASFFRGGWSDPTAASTHNSGLQQLYDAGIAGLACLIGGLALLLRRYRNGETNPTSLAGLALCLTLILTGTTEVTLAPLCTEVTFWIVLILAASAGGLSLQHARMGCQGTEAAILLWWDDNAT